VIEFKDNYSKINSGSPAVFKQEQVPVFQNKVYATEAEALKAQTGQVELIQSSESGFIFNKSFDPEIMLYDENYQNEQGSSGVFQGHLNNVLRLLNTFGLENKKIVEVGCGKGIFFEMMLKSGLDCWGFDPTYEGNNERVIKEYFSDKFNDIKADVIIMRHTLEHIPKPFSFLHTIAKANNYRGYLFVEVPTFDWIAGKHAFWDIFYEHCNYFTEQSLSVMFDKATTGHFFGNQYIYLWADLANLRITIPAGEHFTERRKLIFDDKINYYKKFLKDHGTMAIWGAGAKGSTFLNLLDKKREFVRYVIDINPVKQNRFIAGTGHKIYSPEILENQPVDYILVMNENYIDEIKLVVNGRKIKLFSL
jgi:2-polyprenyl-3-methyl-5-hydroxy-6-metoxy-1,4-benzoquinol methylase